MSDLIERTKPTDEGLYAQWTPSLRQEVLENVLEGRTRRVRPGRRAWPVAVAASILAVLMLAGPIAFPGWFTPNAAAEELGKVATAAGERARLEWAEGQFLRVSYADTQTGPSLTNERTPPLETRSVTFVDFHTVDGWTWSDRVVNGKAERYIFPPTWGWLRPDYATTMPTEPHLLDAFLRTRVTGSTSQDEAVFVAIGDMLRQEAAPPAVRAAAIGVLGLNPKVTVEHTTDPVGRPALKVVFVDEVGRPGVQQFLFLAPDSGLLLANGSEGHGGTYQSVIRERTVVDALPTDLVALLGTEKEAKEVTDGQTTPIQHGTPPVDPQPGAERTEIYTPAPKP